jgi:hypothetical protein
MKNIMEVLDDSVDVKSKYKDDLDLYIMCEGFKYTLREWRRWTRYELILDDGTFFTRGEYSMMFVNEINGILKNAGYILKYSTDSIARRFMHYWMKLYNSGGRSTRLPDPHHNGNDEEFEEWEATFAYDFWEHITEDFVVRYGFDDTFVGKELLNNISNFFWIYIDAKNSPRITNRRAEIKLIEEEMMNSSNDNTIDVVTKLQASKDYTYEDNNRNKD